MQLQLAGVVAGLEHEMTAEFRQYRHQKVIGGGFKRLQKREKDFNEEQRKGLFLILYIEKRVQFTNYVQILQIVKYIVNCKV